MYNEVIIKNNNNRIVLTNGINALYIETKNNKVVIKSKYKVEDEIKIINISRKMKKELINYKIINHCPFNKLTRKEEDIINKIVKELLTIKDDKDKINYLFKEWFNNNEEIDFDKLIKSLQKEYTSRHSDFLKTVHLLTTNV